MSTVAETRDGQGRPEGALGPYLRALGSNGLLVVALTLATVLASCAWLLLRSTTYEATAKLLVAPVAQDDSTFLGIQVLRESSEATRTMQTAATLVATRDTARLTAQRMGDDWTANRVEDSVEVEPEGESDILAVTAEQEDAETAARLADAYALSALEARRSVLEGQAERAIAELRAGEGAETRSERLNQLELVRRGVDPTLSLAAEATVPTSPSGPPTWLVVLLSLVAGFTLASVAALVLQDLDRSPEQPDQLE